MAAAPSSLSSPQRPRRTALILLLLVVSLLFLLSVVVTDHAAAARVPAAAAESSSRRSHEQHGDVVYEAETKASFFMEKGGDDGERCGGEGAGAEREDVECLMRRTLVAHTDYIYTQGGGHN